MRSRVANESEHRRGLVLGLTLAEVLILLLFLILLVLGDRLIRAETTLAAFQPVSNGGTFNPKELPGRMRELEKTVSHLKEENARLQAELADESQKLQTFKNLIAAARAVDPNDPPAVLISVILRAIEIKVNQEPWKSQLEILSTLHRAESSMTAEEREQFRRVLTVFIASGGRGTAGHKWPPIIRLSEADDYFFAIGSVELTVDFEQKLIRTIIPQLLNTAREYQVDLIEVVGHTDEQPIAPRPSNLDRDLLSVLRGEKEIKTLIPADNAGLGLIRAVAVVETLKKDQRLINFRILPLSGAQLIQEDETLSKGAERPNVRERRRIEIRMRKSS